MLADQIDHAVENLAVGERFVAGFAIENRDGHAAEALAGDAPVRPRRDHVADALFSPRRRPLDFVDGFERLLAKVVAIHPDESLLGGAENGRLMTAPAMRITVLDLAHAEQRPGL